MAPGRRAARRRRRRRARPGSSTPPRSPCSLRELDVLDGVVDVVQEDLRRHRRAARARPSRSRPATGCGRGCRRAAARNCSAVGGRAITAPVGKNGGTVFGKMTSPTTPSASSSRKRRSSSQLRSAAGAVQVLERVLVLVRATRRTRRGTPGRGTPGTGSWLRAGVRVGRDQRVAVRHGSSLSLKTSSAFSRRNFGHTWSRNGTFGQLAEDPLEREAHREVARRT